MFGQLYIHSTITLEQDKAIYCHFYNNYDMRLYIFVDLIHCYIVTWHKCCLFLDFKAEIQ